MKFPEDLETHRLENKLTQQQIADKLGVAFVTVNRWLNGHTKPNKIQAYQIEKLLKKSAKRSKKAL